MTTYVKLVKGATKIKMAPPKSKYLDPILLGTTNRTDLSEIIRGLQERMNDTAFTVVFKSLIVLHLLLRESNGYLAYQMLAKERWSLHNLLTDTNNFSNEQILLNKYLNYLNTKLDQYDRFKIDYVKENFKQNKIAIDINSLDSINKAIDLVDSLELQITNLIRVKFTQYELTNELYIYAFKLLIYDLLPLYNALNEGIITLLESFFELTHELAFKTLNLYKKFVNLTDSVVKYLKIGKNMGLKIPVIKHITTKLVKSLEEHLNDDNLNHNTFNSNLDNQSNHDDKNGSIGLAQDRLDEIRKQKKLLQDQLKNQYNPFLPSLTGAATTIGATNTSNSQQIDLNNPFAQLNVTNSNTLPQFNTMPSLTQPQQQIVTQSPSLQQVIQPQQQLIQPPQQMSIQPPQQQSTPQPFQQQFTQPQLLNNNMTNPFGLPHSNTGILAQSQTMPISQPQSSLAQTTVQPQISNPLEMAPTCSNNPFSLNNISQTNKEIEAKKDINPFSMINQNATSTNTEINNSTATTLGNNLQQVSNNPFSLMNRSSTFDISGLESLQQPTQSQFVQQPTVPQPLQPHFTQPQMMTQVQAQPQLLQQQYTQPQLLQQQFTQPQLQQNNVSDLQQLQNQQQFHNQPLQQQYTQPQFLQNTQIPTSPNPQILQQQQQPQPQQQQQPFFSSQQPQQAQYQQINLIDI